MRTRSLIVLGVVGLCACAALPTRPDESKPAAHKELVYDQFVLTADGKSPYDLTSIQNLPGWCGATAAAPPKAGGIPFLAPLLTSLVDKAAEAIVNAIKKWVNARVAEYSSDISGKPARVGFYDDKLWFTKAGEPGKYSCFVIALNSCEASSASGSHNACPKQHADKNNRILIVGQYKLTNEDLQVRALFGRTKGFEAKRNPSEQQGSLAATLKFDSIWWDGHQGHTEPSMTAHVLSIKFKPTSGNADDIGTDLPVQEKDPVTGKYALPDWNDLALLPRPAQSPGSNGTVSITPAIAEANAPPEGLTLVQKALGDNSSQISAALKSALEKLVPK